MKLPLALTSAALAVTSFGFAAPLAAAPVQTVDDGIPTLTVAAGEVDRRGRRKPRIPGGSGCDDPRDLVEHPECAL